MPIIVVLAISRRKRNLTQEQLAQLSGRSQQLIGKLEQGKARGIGFDTLYRICLAIGGEIGDVLAYLPSDPKLLEDAIFALARKLDCSVEEIFPHLPRDLWLAYRRSF
ncbi:MAG: helix-turn-helix domain-containing protein [Cyanobacteria bacterium SBLK]|nr:helix-turn-helix domain-containing protein [Cyanobacteria bacterium SBLK]